MTTSKAMTVGLGIGVAFGANAAGAAFLNSEFHGFLAVVFAALGIAMIISEAV